jgi:hypothetical protein
LWKFGGGYIATVVGAALNAEKVLNFGGQWDISDKDSFFLRKYQNQPERSKYYNIAESSRGKRVFWFYSALCEYDRNELNYVGEYMDEISAIAIKSKFHGDLLIGACYAECLVKSKEELRRIAEKYAGKIVSQRKICGDFLSGKELWLARVNDIINSHKSLYTIRDWMKKVAK